jgi:hypothetical protein
MIRLMYESRNNNNECKHFDFDWSIQQKRTPIKGYANEWKIKRAGRLE